MSTRLDPVPATQPTTRARRCEGALKPCTMFATVWGRREQLAFFPRRSSFGTAVTFTMRIATWNVNGIRARAAQLCEWMERDRPDVVCLQELKAEPAQIPEQCAHADYHVYWHGLRAYSGVSLHIRKGLFDAEPVFSHPDFDMESRIVQAEFGKLVLASVYVPNGGKDYPAKLMFMRRLAAWAKQLHEEGRELVLCGDMNITRTDMDVHPRERKAGHHRPATRGARALRDTAR